MTKQPNPPSILLENIWHVKASNVYFARFMNQRHYNGETYQLQLDSHHRFEKDWDTLSIKLLHSCDAGEHSVLTSYVDAYHLHDPKDPNSEVYYDNEGFKVNFVNDFNRFKLLYLAQASSIEKNRDKLTMPFRTHAFSAHFVFSHGHFV